MYVKMDLCTYIVEGISYVTIVSRICGDCPVMSGTYALDSVYGTYGCSFISPVSLIPLTVLPYNSPVTLSCPLVLSHSTSSFFSTSLPTIIFSVTLFFTVRISSIHSSKSPSLKNNQQTRKRKRNYRQMRREIG